MHWLFLLLAFGALVLAFSTPHMGLLLLSLLASLLFFVLWIRGWYLARMGQADNRTPLMVTPAELQRMREQARARRDQDPAGDRQAH
ncbi:hypothetical protein [Xanthomonas massiliensis]|uniref:hypothetical protein n=1 Tax=Xanthomonas massiliensis TaxID=1720302 RepID=UPI0008271D7B|nr:hypothetical protein [Xanthomonas massiliensis]